MNSPRTRSSEAWRRAGLPERFKKLQEHPEKIGSGATGEVVKGWDSVGDCYVAVKKSHKELDRAACVLREYALMRGLEHPNVVRALASGHRDAGVPGKERAYLVTDWIDGEHLATAGLGPAPRQFLRGLISGVAYLHRQGVHHRDMHNENILRAGTQATIIDFDRARRQQTSSDLVEMLRYAGLSVAATAKQDASLAREFDAFKWCDMVVAWFNGTPPTEDEVQAHALFNPSPSPVPPTCSPASLPIKHRP